jgi:type 1 glutamine amidotransferase
MTKLILPLFVVTAALGSFLWSQAADAPAKPLRVLLVAGGCCHDYAQQQLILKEGIESRIHATVDVAYNPDTSTETTFDIYQSSEWADDFDVIIHDECSANVTDRDYVKRILDAHRNGKPAVNLHCAMHSYRWDNFREPVSKGADNAGWFEYLGLQSSGHGPKEPMNVTFTAQDHPITTGMKDWKTDPEELYNNIQIFPSATPLASATQIQFPRVKKGQKRDPNAKGTEAEAVVAWTNEYGDKKTRVFSTTIGHYNETVADDRYLELVTRGLLWTTHHINRDGTAADGYGR